MRLTIRHVTTYGYAPAVPSVTMRLKLYPGRFEGQLPTEWRVMVNDIEISPELKDSWGDAVATVFARGEIDRLEIVAEGVVETMDHAGVLKGHRAPIRPQVCLRGTPRTEPDAAIAALAASATKGEGTLLDKAHQLHEAVATRIVYTPGSTSAATTAAAALEAGEGVCQDHAHVLIAASRSLGWPARYVTGYYLPGPDETPDAATHAWAEIWLEGLGWVGFDAANDLCPTDAYVRLCSGLDAFDAAPIRGHAEGASAETLDVSVSIAAGQGQSQSQQ